MKFIVDFHNHVDQSLINEYLSTNQCTVLKEWDNFEKVYLVEAASEPPAAEIVAFIKNNDNLTIQPLEIINVNQNYQKTAPLADGPNSTIVAMDKKDWWKNYSLRNPIFEETTFQIAKKGSKVHVYIMDSGIEVTHPEFEEANITNLYTVIPGDYTDKSGHGTALASVICGKTCGITNAKIKNVKIYEPGHNTLQSELLDAFDSILNDVPENHFAIVNCSWIIDKNEWVEYKIREMIDKGMWVIAAAGNNGTSIENVTPASMPEVFTVGAYNEDLVPCDFSNYTGSHISNTNNIVNEGSLDGWAPGQDIYAARISANGGDYGFTAGTSIATAIISAIGAYNIHDELNDDGTRKLHFINLPIVGVGSTIGSMMVSRDNLLDLSDPKYSNSVNKIATIRDISNVFQTLPTDNLLGVVRVGAVKAPIVDLYNPGITKTFEFVDPIPEGWAVINQGQLIGTIDESQGPASGEEFKLITLRAKRTDLMDAVEDITINVYVLLPNFEPTSLPEDHPLNIRLQANPCTWGGVNPFCYAISSPTGCVNFCSSWSQICCDSGKNTQCTCATPF